IAEQSFDSSWSRRPDANKTVNPVGPSLGDPVPYPVGVESELCENHAVESLLFQRPDLGRHMCPKFVGGYLRMAFRIARNTDFPDTELRQEATVDDRQRVRKRASGNPAVPAADEDMLRGSDPLQSIQSP